MFIFTSQLCENKGFWRNFTKSAGFQTNLRSGNIEHTAVDN